MFDRILIAVDGSAPAEHAAAHGVRLAAGYDAVVDAVHVVEAPLVDGRGGGADPQQRGQELLESVTAVASEYGVETNTFLLEGATPEAIASHATDRDVDLLVLGRHGRSGAGERLLGTVTDRVLRSVSTPVLTVGASETPVAYDAVLVPTDGSDGAGRAVPYGESIAATYGAAFHCVSVADVQAAAGVFSAGGVSQEFVDRVESRCQDAVDTVVDRVTADVPVSGTVVQGTPHAEIGAYTEAHDIDVIVMGSTGASSLAGQTLGSGANRVLRTVSVPVLVVSE